MSLPRILTLAATSVVSFTGVPALAEEDNVAKFGVYVTVSDLAKSRAFYAALFGKEPYVQNDRLVGFDVGGALYALFAEKARDRPTQRGDSTVPYIRVKDIEREFAQAKKSGAQLIDAKIVDEGPIRLFRVADPDGNLVEFFALKTPP